MKNIIHDHPTSDEGALFLREEWARHILVC